MAFRDLREFIDLLEREGELLRIKEEVDWHLEMGAIGRRALDLRAPAPLFENVKGYAPGYRVVSGLTGGSTPHLHARVALSMGLPPETSPQDLVETFCQRTERPLQPVHAAQALCREEIYRGPDVDVLRLPIPWVHSCDGGRYVGTWNICVTKDPDTGWVNWGLYRVMVHDGQTLGVLLHKARQHGGHMYFQKYEPRGRAMPIAIALGADPICTITAASSFPYGISEAEMAGALRGAPIEMARCETIDLDVPASSEIVIEGIVPPGRRLMEGPFGEYTGYAVHSELAPVVEVTAVTHRRDPILPMTAYGKLWDEGSVVSSIVTSGVVAKLLRAAGIPFRSVYTYAPQLSIIVSVRPVPGVAHRVASLLWSGLARTDLPYLVIVDEDIDVTNLDEVWWAITTRMHPRDGIHVSQGKVANPLIPWLRPDERETNETAGVYFDARFPASWDPEYRARHCPIVDFEHAWPAEVRERVLSRWTEYGYPDSGRRAGSSRKEGGR